MQRCVQRLHHLIPAHPLRAHGFTGSQWWGLIMTATLQLDSASFVRGGNEVFCINALYSLATDRASLE